MTRKQQSSRTKKSAAAGGGVCSGRRGAGNVGRYDAGASGRSGGNGRANSNGRANKNEFPNNKRAGKGKNSNNIGMRANKFDDSAPREKQVRGKSTSGKRGGSATNNDLLLEGRNALVEALDASAPISCIYASAAAADDGRVESALKKAQRAGITVRTVSTAELDKMSERGSHQGIIAKMEPYSYASVHELIEQSRDKENALIIACDHITDAGNFGAICRTAEVVGACGMLIPNKRNARVNANVYKTSAGAVSHLPIAMEANLVRSLQALKEENFWVVGASEHATQLLWDANLKGRIVLVMGSEGDGLSRLTLETCDMLVALPQAGKVESLNVAQACTALSYEWMRQCR